MEILFLACQCRQLSQQSTKYVSTSNNSIYLILSGPLCLPVLIEMPIEPMTWIDRVGLQKEKEPFIHQVYWVPTVYHTKCWEYNRQQIGKVSQFSEGDRYCRQEVPIMGYVLWRNKTKWCNRDQWGNCFQLCKQRMPTKEETNELRSDGQEEPPRYRSEKEKSRPRNGTSNELDWV